MPIAQLRVPGTSAPGQGLRTPSGQGATPDAFGAGIGQGLQAAGAGFQALGQAERQKAEAAARTKSLRDFTDFQTGVAQQMDQLEKSSDLSTTDFTKQATDLYSQAEQKYLATVPDALKDEFSVRTAQTKQSVVASAMATQTKLSDAYFTKAAQDQYDATSNALALDPSPANLEVQRQRLQEVIDSADIDPVRKQELSRTLEPGLEKIAYRQAWVDQQTAEALGTAGAAPLASDLIQQFDGGTEQEADQVAQAAEWGAAKALGPETWTALPARARGALLSMASDLGEIPDSVKKAVESGDLTEVAQAVAKLGGPRRQAEAERILAIGPEEIGIDSSPSFNHLSFEDRSALRADAQQEVNARLTAQRTLDAAQQNAQVNSLLVNLYNGNAGLSEIDDAQQNGVLTKYEDIAQAHQIYEKRNADLILRQGALDRLGAGEAFDPTSTDDKKALNALVGGNGIQALQNQDADFANNFLVPLVKQAQDIPTDTAGILKGMMRSNDQTKALWAMNLMANLQEASPKAFANRFDDAEVSDTNFWRSRRDFYSPEQLLATINKGNTAEERQNTLVLRQEADTLLKDPNLNITKDLASVIGGNFGGMPVTGWGAGPASLPATPWVRGALTADFTSMFEDEYTKYGNPDEAKKAAVEDMKRVWGVSQASGSPKLMRYPPEIIYPAMAGNHDWIGGQVKDSGLIGEGEGFELVSDTQTESEVDAYRGGADAPPSYVLIKMKDGMPTPAMGPDGKPARIYFSPGQAEYAAEKKWRADRTAALQKETQAQQLGIMFDHSLNTGVPMPADSMPLGSIDPVYTQAQ